MEARYRKKPVLIEAWQLTVDDIEAIGDWVMEAMQAAASSSDPDRDVSATLAGPDAHLVIHTLEGDMRANPGDWVIKGVAGEFYPCADAIFRATYEPA